MTTRYARRRPLRRLWWQGAAGALTTALALLLAQHTAGAVFTTATANGGDRVTSAASFCTSPLTRTENPTADTSVYQAQPTTNYGANPQLGILSASGGVSRVLLKFSLTSPGPYCTITAATLKMYVTTTTPGHEVDVYRVDPATTWTESGVTWSTRPAAVDVPAHALSNAPGTGILQTWTVTALAQAMYSGTNNGLQVQDVAEGVGSAAVYWASKESANPPQLELTWG